MKKLAIIISHPIQYYAPVFRMLAERNKLQLKVFYTWGENSISKFDPGFGREISWDIPLLDGYDSEFLFNAAKDPGSHHYSGIDNPFAIERISLFEPDALLVYGWAYKSHLSLVRHFKGKLPVFFRGDSNWLSSHNPVREYGRKYFLKWVYSHIDFAFYVGTANKEYFKRAGLKEDQLLFAPHAIDNDRFSPDAGPNELRTTLGYQPQERVILYAGKLEPIKNISLLIKTFHSLNLSHARLLIVGNGPEETELKALAAGDARISFLPFQNQSALPAVYQCTDLFCLPSTHETWGLAVNEAMASGKAVLVSDRVGCAADLVRPGLNGAQFISNDAADLGNKLEYLLSEPVILESMGKESIDIIRNYSFARQAALIERGINQIVYDEI